MAGNISSGDFGCCGSWYDGCAANKGCAYHDLMYAMEHCNVFKMFFLDKDEAFIQSWKDSLKTIGQPKKQLKLNRDTSEVKDALAEAMALLASLGL